jgi:hypothetical protein
MQWVFIARQVCIHAPQYSANIEPRIPSNLSRLTLDWQAYKVVVLRRKSFACVGFR